MTTRRVISKKNLAHHNQYHKDQWLAINGKVYNITNYKLEHSGGDDILLVYSGVDATEAFASIGHSDSAIEKLQSLFIGELEAADLPPTDENDFNHSNENDSEQFITLAKMLLLLFAIIGGIYISKPLS